jgi:hypothetical protein
MRGRGDRLAGLLAAREVDMTLVTDLVNVRYLTGFGGTNGACLCGPDTRVFFTDFRYTERAEAEVEGWEAVTVTDDWLGGIAERFSGTVGFEDDHMSVRVLRRLEEKLPEGVTLKAAGGAVEELRRVKDAEELAAISAAAELADEVWRWSLDRAAGGDQHRSLRRFLLDPLQQPHREVVVLESDGAGEALGDTAEPVVEDRDHVPALDLGLGALGVAKVGEEHARVRAAEAGAVRATEAGQVADVDELGDQEHVELTPGDQLGEAIPAVVHTPSSAAIVSSASR